jgi:hypothetical protein
MNTPQTIFLSIVISIAVFLLLREVFCWYFKINKRISLLTDIKAELVQANNYTVALHKFSLRDKGNVNPYGTVGPSGNTKSAYVDKPKESFWRAK